MCTTHKLYMHARRSRANNTWNSKYLTSFSFAQQDDAYVRQPGSTCIICANLSHIWCGPGVYTYLPTLIRCPLPYIYFIYAQENSLWTHKIYTLFLFCVKRVKYLMNILNLNQLGIFSKSCIIHRLWWWSAALMLQNIKLVIYFFFGLLKNFISNIRFN